jgi:dTDP-4-dehydrorhamnose 3,5-epimerase
LNIHDVQNIPLTVNEDERGYLFEIVHATDAFVPRFGQVYIVGDRVALVVRAFHKHEELHDWFCIIKGSAKFVLVDDRSGSPTFQKHDQVVQSDRKVSLLVVPPGIYHGWMSLEPDTIMVSTASHVYNRAKPDEVRVPPEHFNVLLGDDPWRIRGK